MNRVYMIGMIALLVCVIGIELATAQNPPMVNNEPQGLIKGVSIAELNNGVHPQK